MYCIFTAVVLAIEKRSDLDRQYMEVYAGNGILFACLFIVVLRPSNI